MPKGAATRSPTDDRFDYLEERFITIGMLEGKVVVIAHTEQNNLFRIISMRKGTKREGKYS